MTPYTRTRNDLATRTHTNTHAYVGDAMSDGGTRANANHLNEYIDGVEVSHMRDLRSDTHGTLWCRSERTNRIVVSRSRVMCVV